VPPSHSPAGTFLKKGPCTPKNLEKPSPTGKAMVERMITMKHLMRITLVAFVLLLILSVFFACTDGKEPVDTDGETDAVSGTASGTEDPEGDGTVYELASKTTSARIALREGQPYVISLKTESGVEKAGEPIPFNLPSLGKNVTWTHVTTDAYDDGDGGVGYIFRFKNDEKQVTYDLYAMAHPDMAGPFQFFGYITNNGTETLERFTPRSYFTVNIDGESSPTAWTFSKESGIAEGYTWTHQDLERYYEGTGIYQTVLDRKQKARVCNETVSEWNNNGSIPMMYLDYGTSGVYFAMEWTNGSLEAEGLGDGTVSLTACLGSGEGSFKSKIEGKGGTFLMPPVYLGVYDGDVDDGSNIFKHWFLRYKAPDNMRDNPSEPLIQMETRTGFEVAEYGIEAMKWDIAWWNDTGSWSDFRTPEVRSPMYLPIMEAEGCSTLAEYTAKGKENGIAITMYFLLRDLKTEEPGHPSSIGPDAHPEWFGDCNTHLYGADLGNVECVAFFQKYLTDFFGGNGITTWRSDFQPILSSAYMAYENRHYGHDSPGGNGSDMTYWCTVGFGELVDHLIENVEGFRYESCSEGGSMKDLFTATKASVINCDDSGDFMSWHTTFYDSSYCIHPAQLQLPCVTARADANNAYGYYRGIGNYEYGLRCALTGAVMVDMYADTQYQDYWAYYIGDLYQNVMRPLIRNGNLYHILPRPDGVHWDGLQYIDLDSENEIIGMVLLWKPTDTEGPQKTVKLRGLNPEDSYQLTFEDRTEQNAVYTGAQLMESGLTVTIEGESGSEMIWISHAK